MTNEPENPTNEPENPETVFTYAAPALKFGPGASAEVGHDLAAFGARRVLLVTDAGRDGDRPPARIAEQIWQPASRWSSSTAARVEPTDESLDEAIDFARDANTGRRSTRSSRSAAARRIDTAKAVNLLLTNPGELMDYINAPVGKARAPAHAAAAAGRDPDHDRHRQREHHDLRARRARAAR